jgi:Spy/CpxP family protein refolding chaperone
MNRALQWKVIAGFILVFAAGGITGAYVAVFHAHRVFFEMHEPGGMAAHMKERLGSELKLTPEQMNKVAPIVDKTAAQLEQIRVETGQRVHETFMASHRAIAENLTDEQKKKLQEMEANHHRQWHGFHNPPGSPGGPPP